MIFDRWGNPLGDLPYVIKAIRTRATDGTDTLDITTIGEINKDERIVFKDSMGRWAEYLCQSTQTARAAGMPVTVAYCTGSIAELSRTYIEDKRNRNANAKACLAKALEGTRWAVGTVETGTITGTADLSFYHCTVLEAIQKTADTYGLEVQTEYQPDPTGNRIGRRIIHLVEHRGTANTTKRFEYGKDLTQIKRDIDSGDVITRLYGWGKGIEQTNEEGEATGGYGRKISFADVNNGKPYVQDDQALANWGIPGPDGTRRHSEASVDFPDCEDPKELLNLTKAALKTRTTPTVSYTADVTALGQAGYDPEGADVGDGVQIIDTSFTTPLRLEGRILQIEEDLAGSLAETKITLGNIRQSYTQRLAAQQQALDKLVSSSGAWNSAAGGTGPYMKDLIDRINQIMNATGGYAYLKPGQGIYVYDKPEDQNPTQCIHIGGGYWRIADHKKANGDWDFRSLANGKGLFADTIFTGRLSDAAGLNFWDMDTGEFSLSARSTVGGNKASELATTTAAQQLTSEAVSAAKKYADGIGSNTLASAKADATSKANDAEANAKKAASTDATNKANAALEAAKKAAAAGDTSTLEAAKSYADNTATSHVDTFQKALTQQYIFNKLTNNGQLQGLYMSGGLLYVNATYLRSGIISGARSYWNLDSGIFSMTDANGVETVHLDGNGGRNTLTGTFQTGTSGSRLWMSPRFKQKPIGGSADITGAGISFIHATDAAEHPYIASESTNSEVGEISTLTFNGGRRANTDPGAFMRVGSTKTDNAKKKSLFQAMALRDYSLSSNDAKSSGARLVSSASPDINAIDTYSELAAWDPNGAVGVKADINTGYLYMGGFLGGYTNRHTFDGSKAWKAWMPNGGAISVGAATTVHFTASSPAKYGRYYAVANADGEWGGIIMHVKNTGGQSGWDILMYNADRNPCPVDMYCDTFGWLVK
ncbi:phage tail spike protein [Bifidobacterium pseudocatenulatum]|uniref:Phage tail protein n=1 Tax=Bifidobacterium pseudocatenulatum TaxID=28026 RepID=A0AAW4U155_BIFPS|nr:phage tail spike protein [Bifidobacterium pseudocatenulatum]MCB4865011.1 phage tail protein [Bifidobacterium pseudocatenulatum]MCB4880795.1 phage tail protein [Bifidobacterium pseudocatenulatum]